MMNRIFLIVFVSAFFSTSTYAMSTSDLACGAIICLSGDGGSACAPYINKYNSIKVKKRFGRLCKPCTAAARKVFLSQCKKVTPPTTEEILKMMDS